MLLILGSGLSFNGAQLLLMLTLPALCWLGMLIVAWTAPNTERALGSSEARRPHGLLIGLVTALILALVDTDVLTLQALDPALGWLFLAAGASILIAWGLAVLALTVRALWRTLPSPAASVGAGVLWLIAFVVYWRYGQPGFFGDRLFVVLTSQADVSAAATMTDYDERRRFVYTTLTSHAAASQEGLRRLLTLLRLHHQPYYLVNAIEVQGGFPARLLLLARAEIDRVLPSPVLRPAPWPQVSVKGEDAAPAEPAWNLTNIGADRVWREFHVRGAGVIIGQSDSGVQYDHPELADAYRGRGEQHAYNWFDPWSHSTTPVDYGGHGTHTLGSVLGRTVGVAPDATWFACANLQRNLANPALYLDCMQFMMAPFPPGGDPLRDGDPLRAAHVLNNSWGCPWEHEGCDSTSLLPAVQALRAAGIFVVASAGNEGPACGTVAAPLAIYDESISVGAVDQTNNLAIFSSAGPVRVDGSNRIKPDIVAPGVHILSAYPGNSYSLADGTSMAGPHVAGVVALMWSANAGLIGDIERTEEILLETARPFSGAFSGIDVLPTETDLEDERAVDFATQIDAWIFDLDNACLYTPNMQRRPNNIAGYGIVDAYGAVQRALAEP
jgi:hypothetical protein